MPMMRALLPCTALLLASLAVPAAAGQRWHKTPPIDFHAWFHAWRVMHRTIYEENNRIAFLEADPETDDAYRAPIITRSRKTIRQVQAALGPPEWRWISPCCYSRPPIHIH